MSIAGSLEYASNLAEGALRDAAAVDRLLASLGALQGGAGGAPFDGPALSADKLAAALARAQQAMDVQGLKGSQAADLVQQKANAAADLASQKGSQAAVLAAQQAQAQQEAIAAQSANAQAVAAQRAQAAVDVQTLKGSQAAEAAQAKLVAQQEAAASASAAQQNAALAKLVQSQASAGNAQALAAQKSAAQVVAIEAKKDAQLEVLAEKASITAARDAEKRAQAEQKAAEKSAAIAEKAAADKAGSTSQRNLDAGSALLDGNLQGALSQFGPEGQAAAQVLAIVEKIASIVGGLLKAGADLSIASGTFRENTTLAFEGLLGGEAAAAALYEKALDLSDKSGLSKEAVVAKLQKQISAGVSEADALKEINAIAAATLGLGEGKASKIDSLLTKIAATDKVSSRVFDSLGVAGLAADDLYAKLGQTTGKTRQELEALAKAGKLSSAEVSAAIEAVIEDKFGKLRDKAGQTIPRILGDIQDEFARLFDKVTGTEGAGKFKTMLSGFSEMLTTGPQAEKLRSAFNELFGNLFGLIGDSVDMGTAGEIVDGIASGIHRIGEFIKDITPGVSGFFKGFAKGFEQFMPALGALPRLLMTITGGVGGLGGLFEMAGKGLAYFLGFLLLLAEGFAFFGGMLLTIVGVVASAVAAVLGLIGSLVSTISGYWDDLKASVSGLGPDLGGAASGAGGAIIDGFVSGIDSKAGAVAEAVVRAAGNAIAAAKRILGIASPSRVFAEIGDYTGQGFALGIDGAANDVVHSARTMAQDAAAASAAVGMMGPGLLPGGAANANGRGARGGSGAAAAAGAGGAKAGNVYQFAAGAIVIHANSKAEGEAAAEGFDARIRQLAEMA